jgi:predicted nucleic acid-binding protein
VSTDIRAKLSKQGNIIGNNDLWIAAHTRSLGATLVRAAVSRPSSMVASVNHVVTSVAVLSPIATRTSVP